MFDRQGINAKNYFSLEEGDIENKQITLKTEVGETAKFYFDYENTHDCIKEALKAPYLLKPVDNAFFLNMYYEVPVPQEFIGSILVYFAISKRGIGYRVPFVESDYKEPNVIRFRKKRPHNMFLREFVRSPAFEPDRLYFAVDFNMKNLEVTCVEVHPTECKAYRMAFFHIDQLEHAKWEGPEMPLEDMRSVFNDPEAFEALIGKIPEVEGRWIPEDDY